MLAYRNFPYQYYRWNKIHGAPFGYPARKLFVEKYHDRLPEFIRLKLGGEFSIQKNNSTREFEYPWAFFATDLKQGEDVLEIGGGLSGFQFVLDKSGCNVTNVDPGMQAKGKGFYCDNKTMDKLNRAYKTNIRFINSTLMESGLINESFDKIFSISTLEHLHPDEIIPTMTRAWQLLKPGGLFILTVDLFLNLEPFTTRMENEFGHNINIKNMLDATNFRMIDGKVSELYGFDEFDQNTILSSLENYITGIYPALAQCFILEK